MRVTISIYPQKNWLYVYEHIIEKSPGSTVTTQGPIIDTRSEEFKAMHGRARWGIAQKLGVYSQEWDLDKDEIEQATFYTIFKDPGDLS